MIRKAFARLLLVAWTCIAFGQWVSAQAVQVPEKFELYLFGGGSFYKALDDPSRIELVEGGIWGGSFTSNYRKFGLEISAASVNNNVRIVPANTSATASVGARAFQASLDPVFHFTSRTSRVRPYISAGLGWTRFSTTSAGRQSIADIQDPILKAAFAGGLDVNDELTFNYGGGIKFRLNHSGSFGLRVDMRGTISDQPTYGLPEGPSTGFTVATGTAYGFQPTAGLNFWFGKGAPPPPPPPATPAPPPPPPPAPRNVVDVTEITMLGGAAEVCAGTPVGLSVTDTSKFPVRYQWTVNGTPTNGSTPSITITPGDAGGTQNVAVQLLDESGSPNAAAPVTRTIAVRSRPYVRPTIQATAVGQSEVPRGGTATLSATGQGDCGGALTYTWTASEAGLTQTAGTPQQATFNTQGVGFGPATDREEIKQVNITATVRDARGGTASASVPLTIRKPAELVRLPDILFTTGSSRVNNCGKRILLEEVFPRIRSSNHTVVLVGHADTTETAANLDRDRAYSAAQVLVGGADTQVRVESQRIKADWVGTAQTAAKDPGYCGTSTRPSVDEARGAAIPQVDAAAGNRRVEVWLVPAGVDMPPSVGSAKDLPATIQPPKR